MNRIDGYEEPCALMTKEAARALKSMSNEVNVMGYRLKVFDAYRPAGAVRQFVMWGIEDTDIRMKPYFYPDLQGEGITKSQYSNRMLLQNVMVRNGFAPIDCEWWHFTLKDEPYPDTYFEFPVSSAYLKK